MIPVFGINHEALGDADVDELGLADGDALGDAEGLADPDELADDEGLALGLNEGDSDGLALGVTDGLAEILVVGDPLGLADGDADPGSLARLRMFNLTSSNWVTYRSVAVSVITAS